MFTGSCVRGFRVLEPRPTEPLSITDMSFAIKAELRQSLA